MNQADFLAEVNTKVINLTYKYALHSLENDKLITLVRFILFNDFIDLFASKVDVSINNNQRELLRKYESEHNWEAYFDLINKEFSVDKVLNTVNAAFDNRLSGLIASVNKL